MEETPHAREGDAAHWYAAQLLLHYGNPDVFRDIPDIAPNGESITEEMKEGAELYCDSIVSAVTKHLGTFDISKLHIEERVDISRIHPECWGTPDCWFYYAGTLYIWDYKFGHSFVEVFENWQLIEYAAGIISLLGLNGIDDQHTRVLFHIVQPRSYHREGAVRVWNIKASGLRAHFNILEAAEAKAFQPIAETHPSPECAHCLGRHACEALQRSSLSVTDMTTLNVPLELTPDQVGNELRYLKRAQELLEARVTGLSEQALVIIKRGKRVPFFRVEQSVGRERWKVKPEEVATLGEMLGIPLKKSISVLTPKQAIKAGIPEAVIKSYSEEPQGALKLVSDTEQTARKIFGGG
jgi:hypothetical protein